MSEIVQATSAPPAAISPSTDLGADAHPDRLEKIEAELKSLKGKGLAIAVISALLGSGGATAIATAYLSGRTLAVQERLAALQEKQANSEIAQKALQNQQIALQNRQIEADTRLKQQTTDNEKVKTDQESFERRLKAYSMTVDALRNEKKSALQAGDVQKAAALEVEQSKEIAAFRAFIDLQKRYVEENPNVPGWYRLGIAQARQECRRIDQQK